MHKKTPKNHRPIPSHATEVYTGVRFKVHSWEQELFDGTKATFECVERGDGVSIFPIINNDHIVINEEEQPHWDKKMLSIVSGMIDPGETPEEAARRELKEETGMEFEHFYLVHAEQLSREVHTIQYFFVAHDHKTTSDTKPDPGERTHPHIVSFDELISLVKARAFFYRPTFIDEHIIADTLPTLFDIFRNPKTHLFH